VLVRPFQNMTPIAEKKTKSCCKIEFIPEGFRQISSRSNEGTKTQIDARGSKDREQKFFHLKLVERPFLGDCTSGLSNECSFLCNDEIHY
jgi:hypothetical protein